MKLNVSENLQRIADFFFNQFISILNLPQNKPTSPSTPPYIKKLSHKTSQEI